jgi:ribosomal protein S12 methylthiotransferase
MTFAIESLGCAKNQVDSEELIAYLEEAGLSWVADPVEAEAVIVNTCGFITSAKEESIRTALELKDRFPDKKVLMVGCLVARYRGQLAEALSELDGFVGLRDPRAVERLLLPSRFGLPDREAGSAPAAGGQADPVLSAGPSQGPALASRPSRPAVPMRGRLLSFPGSAYLKIAEGCDNRCSYCAIPLIRGPLASRPPAEIVEEAKGLLSQGARELVLIAQDLASYGAEPGREAGAGGLRLPGLLRELLRLPGDFWLRCLYIHPDHFPEELLGLAAADPRLLPYFDLPFQHAAQPVLARMGRRGTAAGYLDLLRRIREALPQAVLRSTFLVGFPGETEEDFQALLDFQREAELDWAGVFTYSREEGTPAYSLGSRVGAKTAALRKACLEQAQQAITERRLERHLGRELEVLIEEPVRGEALALGRAYLQAPEVDGAVVVKAAGLEAGQRRRVRIERRNGLDLEGSLAVA